MFTAEVREELAHAEPGRDCCRLAETVALVRLAGSLELRGGREPGTVSAAVTVTSGAVARRLHASARALGCPVSGVEVHQPGGLQQTTRYRVRLEGPAAPLGLLDPQGRPAPLPPGAFTARACDASSYLRGAMMATGSVSDPQRAAHLEIVAGSEPMARHLWTVLNRCGASGAAVTPHADRWRVVVKSGEQIGALLARAGAHTGFLRWDQARLRRELRGAANRAANADRANLTRSVMASARQSAAIRGVVAAVGLDRLPDQLVEVALARLANPEASLAELGELLDPPVGKATVHRRLERLSRESPEPAEAILTIPVEAVAKRRS